MGQIQPITSEQDRVRRIWEIYGGKFPHFCIGSCGPIELDNIVFAAKDREIDPQEFSQAKAYFDELAALNPEDLDARYREFLDDKEREFEENHPLNSAEAVASEQLFEFYSKMPFWTIDEGLALILGRNPMKFNRQTVERHYQKPKVALEFVLFTEIARRALMSLHLLERNPPQKFLDWAEGIQLDIPQELREAVQGKSNQKIDWKASCERLQHDLDEAKAEIEALRASILKNDLSVRERESLLKMVLGMAIEQYGHDPHANRTPTARNIENDLAIHGISLDQDTIREYLKEAKDKLLNREAE